MSIEINSFGSGRPDGIKRQDINGKGNPKEFQAATPDAGKGAQDSVSLSSSARDIAQLESEIKSLPDIDKAKVDAIKERIASGEYHIDFEKVAQKMLNLEE